MKLGERVTVVDAPVDVIMECQTGGTNALKARRMWNGHPGVVKYVDSTGHYVHVEFDTPLPESLRRLDYRTEGFFRFHSDHVVPLGITIKEIPV